MAGLHQRSLRGGLVDPQRLAGPDVVRLVVHDDLDRPRELDLGERDAGERLLPVHRVPRGHGRDRRDGECSEKGNGDQSDASSRLAK